MSYLQENFNRLSSDDRDTLLEFLDNLTFGEIRDICREQLMDGADTRRVTDAHERFQEVGNE